MIQTQEEIKKMEQEVRQTNEWLKKNGIKGKMIIVQDCKICGKMINSSGYLRHIKKSHIDEYLNALDEILK